MDKAVTCINGISNNLNILHVQRVLKNRWNRIVHRIKLNVVGSSEHSRTAKLGFVSCKAFVINIGREHNH
jgi:hypothetical protein